MSKKLGTSFWIFSGENRELPKTLYLLLTYLASPESGLLHV